MSKLESNCRWNCGITWPISLFSTKAMFTLCSGDIPMNVPGFDLWAHLWHGLFCCHLLFNAWTGKPNGWECFIAMFSFAFENICNSERRNLSWIDGHTLIESCAVLIACGYEWVDAHLGHLEEGCFGIALDWSWSCLILLSDIPFWWWVLTPENAISWFLLWQTSTHPFTLNAPSLVWHALILMHMVVANLSKATLPLTISSTMMSTWRWTCANPESWSTRTITCLHLFLVRNEAIFAVNPGVGDTSMSTDTLSPGRNFLDFPLSFFFGLFSPLLLEWPA